MKEYIDDDWLIRSAEILKAVAHPARLRIIELLEHGERSVGDLQMHLGITQSLTSQHLSHMRVRGILKTRKERNMVFYSVLNPEVINVIRCIRKKTSTTQLVGN